MNDTGIVIKKVNNNSDALTNAIYLNVEIQGLSPKHAYYLEMGDKTHRIIHDPTLDHQTILMNSVQRRENDRSSIDMRNLKKHIKTQNEIDQLHRPVSIITVQINKVFGSTPTTNDTFYAKPEIDREAIMRQIGDQLKKINYLRNSQSYLISLSIGCDQIHCQIRTSSMVYPRYKFYHGADATRIDIVNNAEKFLSIRDQKLFKFKDIQEMGVGGLNSQFDEMFRRAFASRTLDPFEASEIGIEHIRGIMLYGPPGCGKTLIARQICKSMNSVEPILVNGPELLSKFVGESEENLRKIFKPAEDEYAIMKEASNLHVIIFDEMDSLFTHRGSNSGSTGVGDRIVNQLLTKMDGVNELNNIMVIGMTNRIDLIDKALLRPGRFEVQIEIGFPDKAGRVEILNIHTEKLRRNHCLDPAIDLDQIAEMTANYTGAELKGLINSARSYALCRAIDDKDKSEPEPEPEPEPESKHETEGIKFGPFFGFGMKPKSEAKTTSKVGTKNTKTDKTDKAAKNELVFQETVDAKPKIMITYSDLMLAMREVTPAFGRDQIITGIESGLSTYGILNFCPDFYEEYTELLNKIKRFDSSRSNVALITLSGSKGSGKTTIALDIAKKTGYPMIRFVDQAKFVGLTEAELCSKLNAEFKDVANSTRGVIILDDLERLVGFINSVRMRDNILSSLLTMIDKLEKLGMDRKYVVIFTGTGSVIEHITDPSTNLIDPRSIKGHLKLPELPLLAKEDPIDKIRESGFNSYEEYIEHIRQIQHKISNAAGAKYYRLSNYDLFDPVVMKCAHNGDNENDDLPYNSIPIKYYIDAYNDALIRLGAENDNGSEEE